MNNIAKAVMKAYFECDGNTVEAVWNHGDNVLAVVKVDLNEIANREESWRNGYVMTCQCRLMDNYEDIQSTGGHNGLTLAEQVRLSDAGTVAAVMFGFDMNHLSDPKNEPTELSKVIQLTEEFSDGLYVSKPEFTDELWLSASKSGIEDEECVL